MVDSGRLAPLIIGLLALSALLVWADAVNLSWIESLRSELASLPVRLSGLGERWREFILGERTELEIEARSACLECLAAREMEAATENQLLREQLGLRLRSPWRLMTVELTATTPPSVDAGLRDGLSGGEAFLIDGRLAGIIGSVGRDFAEIVPLERAGAFGARLVDCRADGVAEIIDGELLVKRLGGEVLPREGELAVTSTLGRLPAGIPLGRVTRVDWRPGLLEAACSLGEPIEIGGAEFGQLIMPVAP